MTRLLPSIAPAASEVKPERPLTGNRLLIPALILMLLCARSWGAEALQLHRALPVEGAGNLEPSGLAWCDDRLLMVSDNYPDRVFELRLDNAAARARTYRAIEAPAPALEDYPARLQGLAGRWDWEGLACDDDHLYLLSETLAQVLKLGRTGRGVWLGADIYRSGREKGLFAQRNAFAEGLALDRTRAYVAAERHPRGLVVVPRQPEPWQDARSYQLNPFPDLFQPHDFSGLWAEAGALYTLERNHFRVCRRSTDTFATEICWSYRHVEEDPALAYRDRRFGKAEGIARQGQLLYLVLDNNGAARQADPTDRRPWLFIFRLPDSW